MRFARAGPQPAEIQIAVPLTDAPEVMFWIPLDSTTALSTAPDRTFCVPPLKIVLKTLAPALTFITPNAPNTVPLAVPPEATSYLFRSISVRPLLFTLIAADVDFLGFDPLKAVEIQFPDR